MTAARAALARTPVSFPLRLAALLAAGLLAGARLDGALGACAGGRQLALAVRHRANDTGHQLVSTRLEQPLKDIDWQLDIEVGCAAGQQQEDLRVLSVTLAGAPTGVQHQCRSCVQPAKPQPPPGYFFVPGVGYIRPSTNFVTWEEANATCTAEGATLAMATSQAAAKSLVKILNYGPEGNIVHGLWAWLGATDHAQEGTWVSVTGVPLAQMGVHQWYSGSNEPNGGRGENCMVVQKNTGLIGDAPCGWKVAYACEIQL